MDDRPVKNGRSGERRRLALVGYGSFGRFAAHHLAEHFQVRAWDSQAVRCEQAASDGFLSDDGGLGSLVSESDLVVPAVPVQTLAALLEELEPYWSPGTLVVDVSSVKTRPMEQLDRALPPGVEFVGTHPMFGAQSGRAGIRGLPIAVCGGRIGAPRLERVCSFFASDLGLEVRRLTAEEHDREMAYVQGLTHWMARALRSLDLPDAPVTTVAYRHMMRIEENLRDDSWELFRSIAGENPYAATARADLLERLVRLARAVESDEDIEPV